MKQAHDQISIMEVTFVLGKLLGVKDAHVNHSTNLQCQNQEIVTKGMSDSLAIEAFTMVSSNVVHDQGHLYHNVINNSAWVADLPHALPSPQR